MTFEDMLRQDAANAKTHPRWSRLRPAQGRMLIVKPRVDAAEYEQNGVWRPAGSRRREWGLESIVLKIGHGIREVCEGQRIIVAEFGGTPVLDLTTGYENLFWIISEADVMAAYD